MSKVEEIKAERAVSSIYPYLNDDHLKVLGELWGAHSATQAFGSSKKHSPSRLIAERVGLAHSPALGILSGLERYGQVIDLGKSSRNSVEGDDWKITQAGRLTLSQDKSLMSASLNDVSGSARSQR